MELPRQSGKLDIHIEDNVDFDMEVVYKINAVAVDVTGFTATFTVRDEFGQTGDALLTLTELSGITVGTTDGKFTISITDAQAVFGNREMVYDLVIVNGSEETRLLRGKCTSHAGAV